MEEHLPNTPRLSNDTTVAAVRSRLPAGASSSE